MEGLRREGPVEARLFGAHEVEGIGLQRGPEDPGGPVIAVAPRVAAPAEQGQAVEDGLVPGLEVPGQPPSVRPSQLLGPDLEAQPAGLPRHGDPEVALLMDEVVELAQHQDLGLACIEVAGVEDRPVEPGVQGVGHASSSGG